MEWSGEIRIFMFSLIRTKISGYIQSTDICSICTVTLTFKVHEWLRENFFLQYLTIIYQSGGE